MKWIRCLALAVLLLAPAHSWAVQPDEILPDGAMEARARALSRQLRCMVCQNQSIDDSDAALARDLRIIVRERIRAGDSDVQVLDFLTSRYGEFVLLKPSFSWHNALLWTAPLIVLLVGAGGLVLSFRRRRVAAAESAPLSADEERRLREAINR